MSPTTDRNASTADPATLGSITVRLPGHTARSRDARGRYKSRGPANARRIQRAMQQRQFIRRKTALKHLLFEKFFHAFCLQGSERDFLSAARSTGPLVEMFERLVSPGFILGRPERYTRTKQLYKDGGHLRSDDNGDTGDVRAALLRISRNLPVNPKKYIGCRLPIVSRRVEDLLSVREFFSFAADKNALAHSVDESMDICTEMIERYRSRNTSSHRTATARSEQNVLCSRCREQLPQENNESSPRTDCHQQENRLTSTRQESGSEPQDDQEAGSSTRDATQNNAGSTLEANELESDDQRAVEAGAQPSAQQSSRSKKLQAVLETAMNDENFLMVCMLFDEHLEAEFGTFSRVFLEQHRRQRKEPKKLMREVLLFAQSRRDGTINTREHRDRERGLRLTMQLFEAARVSVGLRPYREMRWDFL